MSNKQQTAVECLFNELERIDKLYYRNTIIYTDARNEAYEKAKEMEKEQIEESFANGVDDEYEWHINNVPRKNSETYYNETYRGGEQ